MKILVSYSLYGDDMKFLHGAIRNAETVEFLGDNWSSIFYVDQDVPEWVLKKLKSHGALIVVKADSWHPNGMFWRFKAVLDFEFDYLLIRDVDSRIGKREVQFLENWFRSNKIVHVIRDHPFHAALIMGGLWGVSSDIKSVEINWNKIYEYGCERGRDQDFLQDEVWPKVRHSVFEVGSSFVTSMFPPWVSKLELGEGFVGEAYDETDSYDPTMRELVTRRENSLRALIGRSLRLRVLKLRASKLRKS